MTNSSTLEKMKAMKFFGMHLAFETALHTKLQHQFTADELIDHLIQAEWEYRENKKISTFLRKAKFRYQAAVEEVNFAAARNLDKNTLMRLADCSFIDKKENVLVCGPTGVGKSFIASALGHQACLKGFKVMYFNTAKLFSRLKISKADGSYIKEINRIEKQDLIILDDFGLHPLDSQNRLMLMEIIEDRHAKRSTIIASQLPIAKWYDLFEEQTIADAILDRIVHNAHRIELQGESMRKKLAAKK